MVLLSINAVLCFDTRREHHHVTIATFSLICASQAPSSHTIPSTDNGKLHQDQISNLQNTGRALAGTNLSETHLYVLNRKVDQIMQCIVTNGGCRLNCYVRRYSPPDVPSRRSKDFIRLASRLPTASLDSQPSANTSNPHHAHTAEHNASPKSSSRHTPTPLSHHCPPHSEHPPR